MVSMIIATTINEPNQGYQVTAAYVVDEDLAPCRDRGIPHLGVTMSRVNIGSALD